LERTTGVLSFLLAALAAATAILALKEGPLVQTRRPHDISKILICAA
jgi:hypothetical protein